MLFKLAAARYDSGGETLIRTITADATFRALVARLRKRPGAVAVEGLGGSSAPITLALLAKELQRTFLCVVAHLEQADELRDDMEMAVPAVELLPAFDVLPGEGAASGEITSERLKLCSDPRSAGPESSIIVAPIQALMQPVPTPEMLKTNSIDLAVGAERSLEDLIQWLVDQGFSRIEWVEQPGDFAVRGGIVDVFAHDLREPLRIEYFGDRIESMRAFDLSTQRSNEEMKSVRITGQSNFQDLGADQITNFLRYLPADAVICWREPAEIQEFGQTFWDRLGNPRGMFPVQNIFKLANDYCQVYDARFGGMSVAKTDSFRFEVGSLQRFEQQPAEAVKELLSVAADKRVTVYCDNEAEQQRFREIVKDQGGDLPDSIELRVGFLRHGFEWAAAGHVFVGHHELFHRYRQRRKIRKAYATRPLETWLDLRVGDHVVHAVHGIARFKGIAPLRKGDTSKREEFLTLEFANRGILHVPASQIEFVHKYIGVGGAKPRLSKLGGKRWSSTKVKVEEAVTEFASELLRVQALRESVAGTAYPATTPWQREFEESFIYTETEDQLKVAEEIRADLGRPKPMDRLLCGDVGYGKTELAMRAAFKVVEFGKQVAVLVPTTVLAEQHYQTFQERMAEYPFIIGCLSRFRSRKEQIKLVEAAKKGRIDILIGTHRLLSDDVGFADLGLMIIDEEQRFGVHHKEFLKQFRESVDVLTLTATPIPRTLHMSMVGIRDISSLATPPIDRRSIVTQVRHFDPELVRSAIIREMNRDGQVFFVHNLVHDIQDVADKLRALVPEARIIVGHGQMKSEDLENVMLKFINREADVLVCTTIIESGIDIPTANTILIDRAEHFGLADLHQLRGRVGRYRHRAYCYLLLSKNRVLTPVAAKRLNAIEEYSELGAGFRIAMRDLEIRGAGNVLGSEQSGHIADVGYEMYCQLLERTVRRMKGEADRTLKPVHLELDVAAHIPKRYIHSDPSRMEIYRRLSECTALGDLQRLEEDLVDAFGKFPSQVRTLLDLAELRILAQPWSIRSIVLGPPDVVFEVEDMAKAQEVFDRRRRQPGVFRMPDSRTIHWRLPPAYLEAPTLLRIVRRLLSGKETSNATEPALQTPLSGV